MNSLIRKHESPNRFSSFVVENKRNKTLKNREMINMPVYAHTPEEARENGRKGGKKSGEVRRARKTFREDLIKALGDEETQKKVLNALINQCKKGNVRAFEILRDTIGEKPKEVIEQKQEIKVTMGDKLSEWGK